METEIIVTPQPQIFTIFLPNLCTFNKQIYKQPYLGQMAFFFTNWLCSEIPNGLVEILIERGILAPDWYDNAQKWKQNVTLK